jgi:serine protease Do
MTEREFNMSRREDKLIIIGMLVLVFASLFCWYSFRSNLPELFKSVSPAVVWIGAEYGPNDYEYYGYDGVHKGKIKRQGTGFLISEDGLIATAGHVVKDTETFQLVFSDGTKGRARFAYAEDSDTADVGFIQVTWIQRKGFHILDAISYIVWDKIPISTPIKNLPYLKFDTKVKLAEELIIVGYPWGLQKGVTVTQGIVSALDRNIPFFGEKFMLHTDTASWPGNSGSPVIDMDGEVVGILVGVMYGADNFSLCTPAKIVVLALNKYKAITAMEEAI